MKTACCKQMEAHGSGDVRVVAMLLDYLQHGSGCMAQAPKLTDGVNPGERDTSKDPSGTQCTAAATKAGSHSAQESNALPVAADISGGTDRHNRSRILQGSRRRTAKAQADQPTKQAAVRVHHCTA
jgi:hypothetical protein